jgi:hypothetical protein
LSRFTTLAGSVRQLGRQEDRSARDLGRDQAGPYRFEEIKLDKSEKNNGIGVLWR